MRRAVSSARTEMAAEHGVDRRVGEGCPDGGGLSLTDVRERRIRPEGRREGPAGDLLLAVRNERERDDAGLIGEERADPARWARGVRPAACGAVKGSRARPELGAAA